MGSSEHNSKKSKKSKKEKKSKKSKKQVKEAPTKASSVVESTDASAAMDVDFTGVQREKLKKEKKKKKKKSKELAEATKTSKTITAAVGDASSTNSLTIAEILAYRKANKLTVTGTPTAEADYTPTLTFSGSGISGELLKFCGGFEKPTAIQAQCWPVIMAGVDCIGVAKTGSGKTIAFGLPGLMHISKEGTKTIPGHPTMCVIAPTRELAVQTFEVCENAGKVMRPAISSVCVYGGVPKGPQITSLRRGVGIVVATPGRLYDLMEQGEVNLSSVSYMVLDEADRMLDLGFEKEIKHFMGSCRKDKQTLMFSATWPQEVQAIGNSYMKDPIRVTVGEVDRLAANHAVSQTVEVMENHQKDERLLSLLSQYTNRNKNNERVLIFALYKKEAARLQDQLRRKGYPGATAIHGDLSQDKRTEVLENFKSGACKLMIATDVAARGLDVPELNFVINYTFPLTVEDYVHRVGRTGRAGKKGTSYTFFTSLDKGLAGGLGNVLREAGEKVPEKLMNFGQGTKRKKHAVYGELTATQEAMAGRKATRIKFD